MVTNVHEQIFNPITAVWGYNVVIVALFAYLCYVPTISVNKLQ